MARCFVDIVDYFGGITSMGRDLIGSHRDRGAVCRGRAAVAQQTDQVMSTSTIGMWVCDSPVPTLRWVKQSADCQHQRRQLKPLMSTT